MTIARSNPYLHVTWLTKALVGERNCLWAHCYKTSHEGYARMPNDFDSAHWHIEHTALLDQQLAVELEEQGCQVFIDRQNDFRVEISRSGMVISGVPDVIAVHPDGRAVIYDVKTGHPQASHTAQEQLYMCLLP